MRLHPRSTRSYERILARDLELERGIRGRWRCSLFLAPRSFTTQPITATEATDKENEDTLG